MIAEHKTRAQILNERNSAVDVRFDDSHIWIHLADGRILGVPLSLYLSIASATQEQRNDVTFPSGLVMFPSIGDAIELEVVLEAKYDT